MRSAAATLRFDADVRIRRYAGRGTYFYRLVRDMPRTA